MFTGQRKFKAKFVTVLGLKIHGALTSYSCPTSKRKNNNYEIHDRYLKETHQFISYAVWVGFQ